MKKTISDIIEELQIMRKSHTLNNDAPLVSIGNTVYTIDDVLYILKNNRLDDDLYKSVEEGLFFL